MSVGASGGGAGGGSERMLEWVYGLPDQIRRAWEEWDLRANSFSAPAGAEEGADGVCGAVFLGGMGGSAMAGHLASALLADRLPFPCVVHSGPEVPAWVGSGTRAILSSCSGHTRETLAMFAACHERGARLRIVTSGGRLRAEAERHGVPCFEIPGGYAPRAAFGWLLVPVWRALLAEAREAAAAGTEDSLRRAADALEAEVALWRSGGGLPGRDPVSLAKALAGRIVFILAPSPRRLPVALRWKNQILENAEQAAVAVGFPEGGHNEIMGWRHLATLPPAPEAAGAALVLLDDDEGTDESRRLFAAVRAEAAAVGLSLVEVPGHGSGPVERALADILLGDRLSVELARRRGVDPVPVEAIARFKQAYEEERPA